MHARQGAVRNAKLDWMHWQHLDEEGDPLAQPCEHSDVTDGASSYAKCAQIRSLHHEVVLAKRRVRDAFHVQHVNQHHSALRDLINHHFHGVSSDRLPSYLRLYERTRGTKPWDMAAFFERLAFSTRSLYTKSTQT